MKRDVVADARRRVAELRAELTELESFLETARRLTDSNHASASDTKIVFRRVPLQASCDLAERILRETGPLHISELVRKMIDRGWHSNGNPRRDYVNMHNNLSGQPDRFAKLGKGIFGLTNSSNRRRNGSHETETK